MASGREVFRLRITKTVEGCFRVLAEDGARLSTVGVGARCGASMHHAHKCVQAQKEKEKWLFTVLDFDQFDVGLGPKWLFSSNLCVF